MMKGDINKLTLLPKPKGIYGNLVVIIKSNNENKAIITKIIIKDEFTFNELLLKYMDVTKKEINKIYKNEIKFIDKNEL